MHVFALAGVRSSQVKFQVIKRCIINLVCCLKQVQATTACICCGSGGRGTEQPAAINQIQRFAAFSAGRLGPARTPTSHNSMNRRLSTMFGERNIINEIVLIEATCRIYRVRATRRRVAVWRTLGKFKVFSLIFYPQFMQRTLCFLQQSGTGFLNLFSLRDPNNVLRKISWLTTFLT